MSRNKRDDVEWYIDKRKTPIARSTQAVSDYVVMLTEEFGGTVNDLLNQTKFIWDYDARSILQEYVKRGYGDTPADKLFGVNRVYRTKDGKYTDGYKIWKMEYA